MALADKKSQELYNRKTGASSDSKTIDANKETILQDAFDNKEYIDNTNLLLNAGLVYIIQQMQEDIEELRRYVSNDIDTLTSAQSNAITANTAKVGITTAQASAITTNSAKVSLEGGTSTAISFGDMITVPSKSKGGKDTYNIVMTATKSGLSKSITLSLT
tara:strand:- start:732 stop:1214 length:483 start_codon:yes stop_codon:yes gene_type:complete